MATTLTLPRKRTRLLLVGDDRPCLANLHAGLKTRDYEPVNATTGEEAIEICREMDTDLAIVDVTLPDMCGMVLGRLLYETYHIPVIFLTGDHECAFIDKATREGPFAYLVKTRNRQTSS